MVGRRGTSKALARAGHRATVAAVIVAMLGLAAIGGITGTETPAGAIGTPRDGTTAETAAPSCWSIKQNYPASTDGVYWLVNPKLIEPQQFYCDQTTEGGGWVLIGRGREGWSFQYWGQGSPSTVRNPITGPEAFVPATLSTPTVDALMNGGRMDALGTDGIRLRRASNLTGTTWQEVRMRVKTFGKWSWAFGGGIYLSSIKFDTTTTTINTSTFQTGTTGNVQVANDTRRVFTTPLSGHNNRAGFSYGSGVNNGNNAATSYLWEFANENNAIPFTQVFIRPQISEADVIAQGVTFADNTGLPGSTVKAMLDHRTVAQPWGITGINNGTSIPSLNAHVTAFADIGNTIYIGGKFLQVQHGPGGATFNQPYLAAFDKTTGEWIPTFNPVLNGVVWEIKASPDGTKLFVGGEFTSINGAANTNSLAAVDPATGAPLTSWIGYVTRTTGASDIRALDVQNGWLYAGGQFNRMSGGVGTQFTGPITVGRLARFRLTDGRPDPSWKPNVETAPQDIDASPVGDRVYAVGLFQTLNDAPLNPPRLAVISATTGLAVPGLQPFQPNAPSSTEWQNAILEVGDKVYQGGSQHFIHQYNRADYAFERSHMTKTGGDYQAIVFRDGIIYGACHCNNWQYQDANTWSDPIGYTRTDPINLIGAYDTTNNFEVLPEYHPTQLDLTGANGEGPWELYLDSNNCMWAGGDLMRLGTTASPFYGGFERFCARDSVAPSIPGNHHATVSGNNVTVAWNASTDNTANPIHYEILKDDPTFGTIVMGSTFERSFVDTDVVGPTRYFVRAVDAEGNRSATSPVMPVTPPPPSAATLLTAGSTWSYHAAGQDLGTAWRNPAFDTSSWATGPAQFGWGDGDEATLLPSGTITQYFVKHINVSNPSQYNTATVRLKRDDGAVVYVNGIEVVRDNLPSGALTATTPASGFAAGNQETTFFEYQIPSSLLVNGDNTIAVELHQPDAGNADASFDLELVARNGTETNLPTTPAPTVSDVAASTLTVSWPASTDDTNVVGYLVRRNGLVALFTTATSILEAGLTVSTAYSYDVRAVDTSGNISLPGVVATTTTANPVIVRTGDVWSYRPGGTDPGTEWRQPGFDASSWATGPSELGWGDGGEATVVPSTGITSYYLRHFEIDDPEPFQVLTLRLKRDDGAAVYINGVEVVRSNLPAGPLTQGTWASTSIGGAAESAWNEFTVPGDLLVTGDNVVAVELHQNTSNNVDGSFDLELLRTSPTEGTPPSRPDVTLTGAEESTISFSWTPSTDNVGLLGYVIQRDGANVGFTAGTSFTDTGLGTTTAHSYQVTAIDTSGNASTPGSLAASTTVNPWIVVFGDTWDYLFNGVNQGTAWVQPGFDATAWPAGTSELGIGDNDESTAIGPITTPTPITAYFRRAFEVTDLSTVTALTMDVVRDDGFVVYVNGTEVGRNNMPAGTISYSTRPVAGVADRNDELTPVTLSIPPSALHVGENLIAVEMHQFNNTSNDLSFNLRLKASFGATPVVTLTSPADGAYVNTPTTPFSGLCTTSAGTVTVNISGSEPSILTTDCIANEWTVSGPLPDGGYDASASQTAANITGNSSPVTFVVDTSAPIVTVIEPADGSTSGTATPTLSGDCVVTAGTVTVHITGAATVNLTTPCTAGVWTTTSTPLGTGAYSVTASQTNLAGNTGTSPAHSFSVDATAPVTTDDTASIGNAWRTTPAVVTLTPTDAGSGVAQTYYTTNGDTPTTASTTGTTIALSTTGIYTIKYFSVDALGNTETVKTAGTQIRIDQAPPTPAITFPVSGSSYNSASWTAGCATVGICGTATDPHSGVASVGMTIQRSSNSQYWNGTAWQAASVTIAATGTTSWTRALPVSALGDGITYTVTVVATDAVGLQSPPAVATFTYDTTGPTTTAANMVTTNKNGAINANADTFTVTFNEPLNPATVPLTGVLTLSRTSFGGSSNWGISGLTDGVRTTGGNGYFAFTLTSRSVTFDGTLALSNLNRTVTFTVTGACAGSCGNMTTSPQSGAYQFRPATTLRDVAGNAPPATTTTAASTVMF